MKTRMQPIGQVWSKMPRIVRDLVAPARPRGRPVDGGSRHRARPLAPRGAQGPAHPPGPQLHGPRHRDARRRGSHAGKPAEGKLMLRAFHECGQVVVEITDDGKGIDPEQIAAVAVERGVITRDQAARMDTREIVNLIFRPGFSHRRGGHQRLRSRRRHGRRADQHRADRRLRRHQQRGRQGTTVRVRIPLTLAIIPALVVGEGEERYAIPQANLRRAGPDRGRGHGTQRREPGRRAGAAAARPAAAAGLTGRGARADPGPTPSLTVVVVQADEHPLRPLRRRGARHPGDRRQADRAPAQEPADVRRRRPSWATAGSR